MTPQLLIQPHILLAGRRGAWPATLIGHLRQSGMRVALAHDQAALFEALENHPSLVVLNLDGLGEDGLDVMRRLRKDYEGALILVTAQRRHLADCILALEMGADDYLVSPVDLRELTARIRTILRRRSLARRPMERQACSRLRFGIWDLDGATRLLRRYGQAPVRLTRGEFALLAAFIHAPQQALSRDELLRATRAVGDPFDRSIDTRVRRLRRKLQSDCQDHDLIATVYGVGYAFRAEIEPV